MKSNTQTIPWTPTHAWTSIKLTVVKNTGNLKTYNTKIPIIIILKGKLLAKEIGYRPSKLSTFCCNFRENTLCTEFYLSLCFFQSTNSFWSFFLSFFSLPPILVSFQHFSLLHIASLSSLNPAFSSWPLIHNSASHGSTYFGCNASISVFPS